ncbi:MAG: hypothetical protein ACLGH3_01055, partial [Actinomycetota bacterium]
MSAALVGVAILFFVIGVTQTGLSFIYASMAASLASFATLILGVIRGRKRSAEEGPAVDGPILLSSESDFRAPMPGTLALGADEANTGAAVISLSADDDDEDDDGDAKPAATARSVAGSSGRPRTSRIGLAGDDGEDDGAVTSRPKSTAAAARKPAAKKPAAKKPAAKKPAAKKPAAKKPAAKKPAAKKPAAKKPAAKK